MSGSWYQLSRQAAGQHWDDCGTSLLIVGFLVVSTFLLGTEWIVAILVTASPIGNWPSPPALLVCVMVSHTAWCWPVGLTANVIHSLVFFCWEKSFFVWLFALATSWLTCSSWWWWWCLLSWGWLAISSSSWVSHLRGWGPVHLPLAPNWAPKFGLSWVYHLILGGGSCTRSMAVAKQLNKFAWNKIGW